MTKFKKEFQALFREMGFDENAVCVEVKGIFMKQLQKMFEMMHATKKIPLSKKEMKPLFEMFFDSSFDDAMLNDLYAGYKNKKAGGVLFDGFLKLVWTHCLGDWNKKKLLTAFETLYYLPKGSVVNL